LNRFYFPMDGADGPTRVDRARDGRYDRSARSRLSTTAVSHCSIVIMRKTVAYLYADLQGSLNRLDGIRPVLDRVRDLIAQAMRKQGLTIQLRA
jgi:hypothetical protein